MNIQDRKSSGNMRGVPNTQSWVPTFEWQIFFPHTKLWWRMREFLKCGSCRQKEFANLALELLLRLSATDMLYSCSYFSKRAQKIVYMNVYSYVIYSNKLQPTIYTHIMSTFLFPDWSGSLQASEYTRIAQPKSCHHPVITWMDSNADPQLLLWYVWTVEAPHALHYS